MRKNHRVQDLLEDIKILETRVDEFVDLVIEELSFNRDTRALVGVSQNDISHHAVTRVVVGEARAQEDGTTGELGLANQVVGGGTGLGHGSHVLGESSPPAAAVGLDVEGLSLVVAGDPGAVHLVVVDVGEEVGPDGVGVAVVHVLSKALLVQCSGVVGEGSSVHSALPLVGCAANVGATGHTKANTKKNN